MKKELKRRKEK